MKLPKPTKRGDSYYLRRRVRVRFRKIEDRKFVHVSLKTDDLVEAQSRMQGAWSETVAAWEARLRGDEAEAVDRMTAAKEIAQTHGFRYLPRRRIMTLPLEQLVERVEAATNRRSGEIDDPVLADALLGTAQPPKLTIADTWDIFWEFTKDVREPMNADQIRIWRNARRRSIMFMAEATDNAQIESIGADELLDYRNAMWERVRAGEIKRGTANKEMGHAFQILRTVNRARRLGLHFDFSGMAFKDTDSGTRRPFSDDWIKDQLLTPGALEGLNTEARVILLATINTGCRPSELAGLRAPDIQLDAEIPSISINSASRILKTRESERIIPLVGVSLEAMRECPEGFPRYRAKSTVSATVNKYLREKGLRETPDHTLYGLRHSFEDRLLHAGIDERVRRDLMGHKLSNRERYGAGARLEMLHDILSGVAILLPPQSLPEI